MTELRHHLYTVSTAQDAYEEIQRLEGLFKTTFKRALPVSLYLSSWGAGYKTRYGITAYYDATQLDQLEFLKNAVNDSTLSYT